MEVNVNKPHVSETWDLFLYFQDILEFIDSGCNGFQSNICLLIASYKELFVNRQAGE